MAWVTITGIAAARKPTKMPRAASSTSATASQRGSVVAVEPADRRLEARRRGRRRGRAARGSARPRRRGRRARARSTTPERREEADVERRAPVERPARARRTRSRSLAPGLRLAPRRGSRRATSCVASSGRRRSARREPARSSLPGLRRSSALPAVAPAGPSSSFCPASANVGRLRGRYPRVAAPIRHRRSAAGHGRCRCVRARGCVGGRAGHDRTRGPWTRRRPRAADAGGTGRAAAARGAGVADAPSSHSREPQRAAHARPATDHRASR